MGIRLGGIYLRSDGLVRLLRLRVVLRLVWLVHLLLLLRMRRGGLAKRLLLGDWRWSLYLRVLLVKLLLWLRLLLLSVTSCHTRELLRCQLRLPSLNFDLRLLLYYSRLGCGVLRLNG